MQENSQPLPSEPKISDEQFKTLVIEDAMDRVYIEALRDDAICFMWLKCLLQLKIEAETRLGALGEGAYNRKGMTIKETYEFASGIVFKERELIRALDTRLTEATVTVHMKNNNRIVQLPLATDGTLRDNFKLLKENNKRLMAEIASIRTQAQQISVLMVNTLHTITMINEKREAHRSQCVAKRSEQLSLIEETRIDRSMYRTLIAQVIMRIEDKDLDDDFTEELKNSIGWLNPEGAVPILITSTKHFKNWLRSQVYRTDAVGVFSRAASQDKCLPSMHYEVIKDHLITVHNSSPVVLAVFDRAFDEYSTARQDKSSTAAMSPDVYAELG